MMDFPKLNELKAVAQAAIDGGTEEEQRVCRYVRS